LEIKAMKKWGILAAVLAALMIAGASTVSAQEIKAYWTTSGMFGPFPIQDLIPSVPKDRQRDITIPISMWIIDHPKGVVIYDTGNNVAISDGKCKDYWAAGMCDFLKPSQTRADVIDMQLKKLGYSVDKVKAVIVGHGHLDHIGNLEMFSKSLIVIQKKELYQIWWPEAFQRGPAFVMGDYDNARDFNYIELNGDYDLFGDGAIMVLSTPGHTLGTHSVKVTTKSGSFVITGDAVWMKENLDGYPAGLNYSVKDYTDSINKLKYIRDLEGAPLYMAHDADQFKAMGNKWYR
jgi:glyoxylase-like metal-dependent hydrolase (beta-lactamase superfamily II)